MTPWLADSIVWYATDEYWSLTLSRRRRGSKGGGPSQALQGQLYEEEPERRRKDEDRLRAAVLRTRGVLFQLMKEGRLPQLPLVMEFTAERVVPKGALGRAIERRLKEALEAREGEESGGGGVGDGDGEQQHRATLPKAPKRIKVCLH